MDGLETYYCELKRHHDELEACCRELQWKLKPENLKWPIEDVVGPSSVVRSTLGERSVLKRGQRSLSTTLVIRCLILIANDRASLRGYQMKKLEEREILPV